MLVIGLTGGIGSGKSTVREFLATKGATVIDADKIGHQIYEPNTEAWKEVVATWGSSVLLPSGEINRKRLGEIVFSDPKELDKLNRITHPRILAEAARQIQQHREQGAAVVVLEAALLIEANWARQVDEVWVVTTPEETVVERLAKRNGMTPEQVRARLRGQMPVEEKLKYADVVIDNSGALADVGQLLEALWVERVVKKGHWKGNGSGRN